MKRNLLSLLALASLAFTLSAEAAPNKRVPSQRVKLPSPAVSCGFYGTPVEFPNDVRITNDSKRTLKKGTRIAWGATAGNPKGTHALSADLAPGKSTQLSNVVPGGIEAGRPCKARVIPAWRQPIKKSARGG